MQQKENIMIFGDSITKGVVLCEADGRYRPGQTLDLEAAGRPFGLNISNHSRFGCTLEKGLTVLRRIAEKESDCGAVILEYGGNDCDFRWDRVAAAPKEEHLPNTPIERFTELYAEAIEFLRGRGIAPVLTTLPPLCSERYLSWICRGGLSRESILGWLGDVNAIYRYQERYSRAVEALSRRFGTALIDLRSAFLAQRQMEELYCSDGIHPNEKGQQLIQRVFGDFFASALPAKG